MYPVDNVRRECGNLTGGLYVSGPTQVQSGCKYRAVANFHFVLSPLLFAFVDSAVYSTYLN